MSHHAAVQRPEYSVPYGSNSDLEGLENLLFFDGSGIFSPGSGTD